MHKRKDGKVVASLTEVKNKTGDIFSLVDEFGEVLLTSYNKPRYRIVKVDISEVIELSQKESAKKPKAQKPSKPKVAPVAAKVEEAEAVNKFAGMQEWEAASSGEKDFVEKITEPLQ